jgi:hypothetical protein
MVSQLALYGLILAVFPALNLAIDLGKPTIKPFMEPYFARVGPEGGHNARKFVRVLDNEKGRKEDEVDLSSQRKLAIANFMSPARRGAFGGAKAMPEGDNVLTVFKDEKGELNRASGKDWGEGGKSASGGVHKAVMRNDEERRDGLNVHNARLQVDNGAEFLDTSAHKSGRDFKTFKAENDKKGYENRLSKWENGGDNAAGSFFQDNKDRRTGRKEEHEWNFDRQGEDWQAELKEPGAGRFGFHKICKAEKVGESVCTDQNGRRIGKVVTDSDLNGVVYAADPITGRSDIPVASAHCEPDPSGGSDQPYDCKIGESGLFVASVDKYESFDCMAENGMPEDKDIEIEEPLTFNYQHTVDGNTGGKEFYFPSCFDASANIYLKNFNNEDLKDFGKRLAFQWEATILPIGKLHCRDRATCPDREDSCYYCNGCEETKQSSRLSPTFDNWDHSSLCGVGGLPRMRVKTTICPPPEAFDWTNCYRFGYGTIPGAGDLSDSERRADLNVIQKFYLLPHNIESLRSDCKSKVKNFFQRTQLLFQFGTSEYKQYLIDQLGGGSLAAPKDGDLYRFCVARKIKEYAGAQGTYDKYKGKLVGCKRGVVNFSIGGSHKKASNFMLKSVSQADRLKDLFARKKCPADKFQQEEDRARFGGRRR